MFYRKTDLYITVVCRPSAHTRPNAHPQTLENLNFFPSLFNVGAKCLLSKLRVALSFQL